MNEQKQKLRKYSAKIDILQNNYSADYQADFIIKVFGKYQ